MIANNLTEAEDAIMGFAQARLKSLDMDYQAELKRIQFKYQTLHAEWSNVLEQEAVKAAERLGIVEKEYSYQPGFLVVDEAAPDVDGDESTESEREASNG